jgi:hypothetical protein
MPLSARRAAGQWGTCHGEPASATVWTCTRTRQRWRAFACAVHVELLDGARSPARLSKTSAILAE